MTTRKTKQPAVCMVCGGTGIVQHGKFVVGCGTCSGGWAAAESDDARDERGTRSPQRVEGRREGACEHERWMDEAEAALTILKKAIQNAHAWHINWTAQNELRIAAQCIQIALNTEPRPSSINQDQAPQGNGATETPDSQINATAPFSAAHG